MWGGEGVQGGGVGMGLSIGAFESLLMYVGAMGREWSGGEVGAGAGGGGKGGAVLSPLESSDFRRINGINGITGISSVRPLRLLDKASAGALLRSVTKGHRTYGALVYRVRLFFLSFCL